MSARLLLAALCAASCASLQAQPAAYPAKPVTVVVTFPPGGSTDLVARALAPAVAQRLGQQVVIENRPGAGGNIGLLQVAKAAPDGYTLGVGAAGALAINVSVYPKMPFDPAKDFAPVTMLAAIPFVLVANPQFPARSIAELLSMAKAQPRSASVAYGGNGTTMHLSLELLKFMAGVELPGVTYKGSGPAAADAVGGHVPLAMVDLPASLGHLRSGRLNGLAVTSTRRLAALPDVPTMAEAGIRGYESVGWFGLVAPAGTPAAIVARLNAEFVAALTDPAIRERIESAGAEAMPSSPEDFGRFIREETSKWARVVKAANIKLE